MEFKNSLKKEVRDYLESLEDSDLDLESGDSILEYLQLSEPIPKETTEDPRWYGVVVKIGDRYIAYDWYHMTGDSSAADMGLPFDLASVRLVKPVEKTVTVYVADD
jgi:hypothetical protein